jgi:hypothetical protein
MRIFQDKHEQTHVGYQHRNGNREHELLGFSRAVDSRTNSRKQRTVDQIASQEIEKEKL